MDAEFLATLLQRPQTVKSFWEAARLLKRVEEDLKKDLLTLGKVPKKIHFPHLELGAKAYFQRNFFSILFVTIYQSLGFSEENIYHYARLLHLIRGVVTATDNILDDEKPQKSFFASLFSL